MMYLPLGIGPTNGTDSILGLFLPLSLPAYPVAINKPLNFSSPVPSPKKGHPQFFCSKVWRPMKIDGAVL